MAIRMYICAYIETSHVSFMWYTPSTYMQLCMIFYLLLHIKLCCLLSAPIREGFLISSVECPKCCWELYMQYNLCIMDTLRLFISVLTIRVYLIIQVSLQVHAKAYFGSITKWFYTWLCSPQVCNNNNNTNNNNNKMEKWAYFIISEKS